MDLSKLPTWVWAVAVGFLVYWFVLRNPDATPSPGPNNPAITDKYDFYKDVPTILEGKKDQADLFAGLCDSFADVLELDLKLPETNRKFKYFGDVESYLTFSWSGSVTKYNLPPELGTLLADAFSEVGDKADQVVDSSLVSKLTDLLRAASKACELVK